MVTMVDSMEKAWAVGWILSKEAVVEHQAGRTWIARARVEVAKAHPADAVASSKAKEEAALVEVVKAHPAAAAATGQLVGALVVATQSLLRAQNPYMDGNHAGLHISE